MHSFLCSDAQFSVHTVGVVSPQFALSRPLPLFYHPFFMMGDAPPSWVTLAVNFLSDGYSHN
ncbi:MAG: hypothetical protein OET81_04080, partial [Desulfobacteraceae bacterium]|nr:hypothetical protein [Desulfobacteraceae bacterium]